MNKISPIGRWVVRTICKKVVGTCETVKIALEMLPSRHFSKAKQLHSDWSTLAM